MGVAAGPTPSPASLHAGFAAGGMLLPGLAVAAGATCRLPRPAATQSWSFLAMVFRGGPFCQYTRAGGLFRQKFRSWPGKCILPLGSLSTQIDSACTSVVSHPLAHPNRLNQINLGHLQRATAFWTTNRSELVHLRCPTDRQETTARFAVAVRPMGQPICEILVRGLGVFPC
jgi:hypothetical protein